MVVPLCCDTQLPTLSHLRWLLSSCVMSHGVDMAAAVPLKGRRQESLEFSQRLLPTAHTVLIGKKYVL